MKLDTRLFGTIDYQDDEVVTFPDGIPGFEDEHKFLFVPVAGVENSMLYLQSIATPYLSFLVMDPFSLDPAYMPALAPDELKSLQVKQVEELCFYVFCALKKPVSTSTANLKCPVAFNPSTRVAYQVILDSDRYHMHHPLSEFARHKEG